MHFLISNIILETLSVAKQLLYTFESYISDEGDGVMAYQMAFTDGIVGMGSDGSQSP